MRLEINYKKKLQNKVEYVPKQLMNLWKKYKKYLELAMKTEQSKICETQQNSSK